MPIGGHKGIGIIMMVELIACVLNRGNGFGKDNPGGTDATERSMNRSQIYVAIKPDFFLSRAELDQIMDNYMTAFRAVPPKPGVEKVLLPGELEYETELDRRKNGIPVSEALIKELNDYSDKIGIPHVA